MLLLLCYYSFLVSLDRCGRSWDTLNLAYKIYVKKQNEGCKNEIIYRDNKNKWIKSIDKTHVTVVLYLMVKQAIQIKNGVVINANVNVKN